MFAAAMVAGWQLQDSGCRVSLWHAMDIGLLKYVAVPEKASTQIPGANFAQASYAGIRPPGHIRCNGGGTPRRDLCTKWLCPLPFRM